MLNHKPGPVENHYCFVFFYSVGDIWYNHTEYCPPFIQLVLNSACWVFPWRIPQQHGPELILDQCYVSLYRIRYVPGTAQASRKKTPHWSWVKSSALSAEREFKWWKSKVAEDRLTFSLLFCNFVLSASTLTVFERFCLWGSIILTAWSVFELLW